MFYSQTLIYVFILCFSALISLNSWAYSIEISEHELQQKLDAKAFKHEDSLIKAEVTSSKIRLIDKDDQVELSAAVKLLVLKQLEGLGDLAVQGRITYRPDQGAFYYQDPIITRLSIAKIAPEYMPLIQQVLQKSLSQALKQRPIYVLDDNDIKHKLAKSTLESVTVKNNTLIFDFSLF